jgi:diguanylate cyclase (GGDEF)-like protein/PAS domain S-box-containing protein
VFSDFPHLRRWLSDAGIYAGDRLPTTVSSDAVQAGFHAPPGAFPLGSNEFHEPLQRLLEAHQLAGLGYWHCDSPASEPVLCGTCLRMLGLPPSPSTPGYMALGRRVEPDDLDRFRSCVKSALRDGHRFEADIRIRDYDGALRWVRILGQPARNSQGDVVRIHGTAMDITRRKMAAQRLATEHAVTRMLAETPAPAIAMPAVLEAICASMDWSYGAYWVCKHGEPTLSRGAVWRRARSRPAPGQRQQATQVLLPHADGLLGRALSHMEPLWIIDVTNDADFASACPDLHPGPHSALAFPLLSSGSVIGIIELHADTMLELDPDMLGTARFLGHQIGQSFQRYQTESALRESEAHFRSLVEQASDCFYLHDVDGRLIDVNQRACYALGYSRSELLAMSLLDIDINLSRQALRALLTSVLAGKPAALESRHRHRDGTVFQVEVRIGAIEIAGRQHLLSLARDITERRELQNYVEHLAFHDPLTDLPNRAMFNRRLSHALVQARRYHKRLALLFIDLDHFKNVNDTLGHHAGDCLLQEIARRLTSSLRRGDLVARLGGDEFVVLLEEITGLLQVAQVARQILAALAPGFQLDGQCTSITASIGISTFPDDGADESTLLKHADVAMYRAKYGGKNNFQYYSALTDP